jgi:hypothetical protein
MVLWIMAETRNMLLPSSGLKSTAHRINLIIQAGYKFTTHILRRRK